MERRLRFFFKLCWGVTLLLGALPSRTFFLTPAHAEAYQSAQEQENADILRTNKQAALQASAYIEAAKSAELAQEYQKDSLIVYSVALGLCLASCSQGSGGACGLISIGATASEMGLIAAYGQDASNSILALSTQFVNSTSLAATVLSAQQGINTATGQGHQEFKKKVNRESCAAGVATLGAAVGYRAASFEDMDSSIRNNKRAANQYLSQQRNLVESPEGSDVSESPVDNQGSSSPRSASASGAAPGGQNPSSDPVAETSSPCSQGDSAQLIECVAAKDQGLRDLVGKKDFLDQSREALGQDLVDFAKQIPSDTSPDDIVAATIGAATQGLVSVSAQDHAQKVKDEFQKYKNGLSQINLQTSAATTYAGGGGSTEAEKKNPFADLAKLFGAKKKEEKGSSQEIRFDQRYPQANNPKQMFEERSASLFNRISYRYEHARIRLSYLPWAYKANQISTGQYGRAASHSSDQASGQASGRQPASTQPRLYRSTHRPKQEGQRGGSP